MVDNTKSSFILKDIFKYISEYKKLKIVNYNKKMQNRLDLSLLNYKKI